MIPKKPVRIQTDAAVDFLRDKYGIKKDNRHWFILYIDDKSGFFARILKSIFGLFSVREGFSVDSRCWPDHLVVAKSEAKSTVLLDYKEGAAWKVISVGLGLSKKEKDFNILRYNQEVFALQKMADSGLRMSPPLLSFFSPQAHQSYACLATELRVDLERASFDQWHERLEVIGENLIRWYRFNGIRRESLSETLEVLEQELRERSFQKSLRQSCLMMIERGAFLAESITDDSVILSSFVHGDVAPRNALVSREEIYLIDWGDSRWAPLVYDLLTMELNIVANRRSSDRRWSPWCASNDQKLSAMAAGVGDKYRSLFDCFGFDEKVLHVNLLVAVLERTLRRHDEGEDVYRSKKMKAFFFT